MLIKPYVYTTGKTYFSDNHQDQQQLLKTLIEELKL